MREPLFTDTLQISVVVRDLDEAMRTYVHEYSIGPWDVYEFNPGTVRDMREHGEPVERSWRLAIAQVGQVQWELVQPLDDDSIYATFLATHGPGVHHVGVEVGDYDSTLAELAGRERHVVFGGEYNGARFAYLSTGGDLGVITEIFSAPPGVEQKPDATYPPAG
jgi:Glyoxalase/Bleomycin resistance protein/Dioxygenase superfamily